MPSLFSRSTDSDTVCSVYRFTSCSIDCFWTNDICPCQFTLKAGWADRAVHSSIHCTMFLIIFLFLGINSYSLCATFSLIFALLSGLFLTAMSWYGSCSLRLVFRRLLLLDFSPVFLGFVSPILNLLPVSCFPIWNSFSCVNEVCNGRAGNQFDSQFFGCCYLPFQVLLLEFIEPVTGKTKSNLSYLCKIEQLWEKKS